MHPVKQKLWDNPGWENQDTGIGPMRRQWVGIFFGSYNTGQFKHTMPCGIVGRGLCPQCSSCTKLQRLWWCKKAEIGEKACRSGGKKKWQSKKNKHRATPHLQIDLDECMKTNHRSAPIHRCPCRCNIDVWNATMVGTTPNEGCIRVAPRISICWNVVWRLVNHGTEVKCHEGQWKEMLIASTFDKGRGRPATRTRALSLCCCLDDHCCRWCFVEMKSTIAMLVVNIWNGDRSRCPPRRWPGQWVLPGKRVLDHGGAWWSWSWTLWGSLCQHLLWSRNDRPAIDPIWRRLWPTDHPTHGTPIAKWRSWHVPRPRPTPPLPWVLVVP